MFAAHDDLEIGASKFTQLSFKRVAIYNALAIGPLIVQRSGTLFSDRSG